MKITYLIVVLALVTSGCSRSDPEDDPNGPEPKGTNSPRIASLAELSIQSLRERRYGSQVKIEETVNSLAHQSFLASYESDGLRVYTRVDIPASPVPATGYPVVVFVHGWVGIDKAPSLDFFYADDNNYGAMISAYVAAGFAVLAPGLRGHGTVNGVPAEGIEFMQAWDNGSYLSPAFYAVDILNLLDGLSSIEQLDLAQINLVAHSQGGDVALIALAAAGEGSNVRNNIHAASIWSGTIPSRFTQLETFWPMQTSPEAFMSGDGTWNGTAVGADGRANERFVFGYPADWIATVNADEWTWQKDTWSIPDLPDAIIVKLDQMYAAINTNVDDIDDAIYKLARADGPAFAILHDTRVSDAIREIDAFDKDRYLTEPLALHYSDRDFYSFPEWNTDLCRRTNSNGEICHSFEYPENTHSLGVSEHRWFSSDSAVAGFPYAIQRDIALFNGKNPAEIPYP